MNKNKQKILMYAEVSRKVSKVQDTYVEYIAEELNKLYPDLIVPKDPWRDSPTDWACDIVSCDSNQEVIETLNRIENILLKREHEEEISKEERLTIKIKELENYIALLENRIKELS